MRNPILAIDFDGTIAEHEFPYIGAPKKNAVEVINRLYKQGFQIIVWTCRTTQFHGRFPKDAQPTIFHVKEWLEKHGIPFHTINNNVPEIYFQPVPKVYADVYIDDRQLGGIPDDWEEIYQMIMEQFPAQVG